MPYELGLVHAIVGALTWFALVAAVQFVLLPTLTDRFRQRIFFLRRQMFLLLLETPLQAEEPAYTHLRSTMNGILRFAERLTLARLLIHSVLFRKQTQAYNRKLQADLALVQSPVLREQLAGFRFRLGQEIIRHVVMVSPLAWFFLFITAPLWAAVASFRGVQSLVRLGRTGVFLLGKHLSVQGIEAQAEALVILS